LCCFLFFLNVYLAWKLYKFSLLIIDIEDAIESSLDILNERYKKLMRYYKSLFSLTALK
jgi:hypothetical protein